MSTNFPTSADNGTNLPNPTSTSTQNSPDHASQHANANDAIKAIEGKVGTGASTPVVSTLLFGTGTGTSAWTQLTSAQLAASLTNETGSGSAVFGTSPTLVTPAVDTINESTPANGVTVAGLNIKSGVIQTASSVNTTAIATGIQLPDKMKNPYKFNVFRNAAANLAVTAGLITFDTKSFDTGSNYDTSTGKFTAPIAGFYQFNAGLGYTAVSGFQVLMFYKNGSEVCRGQEFNTTSTTDTELVGSAFLQLAIGDYIQVYGQSGGTTALNLGVNRCFFQGFLVSAT